MERMNQMIRSQILLTPEQRRRLEVLAKCEGRSLSDVARRAIEAGLDMLEGHTDEALQQQLAILEELSRMRAEMRSRYGVYQGDLVAECRWEREQEMERVWRGQ